MGYRADILREAWTGTSELVFEGWGVSMIIGALIAVGTILLVRKLKGNESAKDTVQDCFIGLGATLIVGFLIFIIQVVWIAPSRLYRQSADREALMTNQIQKLTIRERLAKQEGWSFSARKLESGDGDDFSIEVVVAPMAKKEFFGMEIICDRPISGRYYVVGGQAGSGISSDVDRSPSSVNPEKSYLVWFQAGPVYPISPKNPLVITLSSKESFEVMNVNRWKNTSYEQ